MTRPTVPTSMVFLLLCHLMIAASCSSSERQSVEIQVSCAKTDGVPMHAGSGGEGEVRETLAQGDAVTVLRSKEGWSLVRLKSNRRSGWIEAARLGKCPEGASSAAKRPAKAATEAAASPAQPAQPAQPAPAKAAAPAETEPAATEAAAAESATPGEAEVEPEAATPPAEGEQEAAEER